MSETVIIGAGPAGLTAAYELSKMGMHSTILEADRQVGGLSRTVNYRDYRFDIGGHRFFSKVPLVNQLWDEILGDEFLTRPRLSRIHYRGHFFDYPLKPLNALAGLGPVEAMLVGLSYAKVKMFPSQEESNFEQWVANRFGNRLYEIFFKTYTEKVWGMPCNEISADWATQRIKNLSLTEAVKNALLGSRAQGGEVITSLIEEFHYPRLGPGMMWDACRAILDQRGHSTVQGMTVERVAHANGRIRKVAARTDDDRVAEFGGDDFISSMPIRELIHALDPPPPAEVLRAADALRYRDYLTVVLIVDREEVFPDNWIYIHSPEVQLGRIQNYKNWSPEMVPDPSRTSLGLEYFLWDSDDQWTWDDGRLHQLGIRECTQIGLIDEKEVEDATVVRMRKAYPVYDQAYEANVNTIRAYLKGIGNLQLIGRNGQHRYNNQDHSMMTGVYAARNIAGADYDIWSVNTEQEYHEEGASKAPASAAGRLVPMPIGDTATATPEQLIEAAFARLDAIALGGAVGIVAAIALFLATSTLLIRGGESVGPNLALLGQYFIGFEMSWTGAAIGALEVGALGFLLGWAFAGLRNLGITSYASMLKRRAESNRDVLGQV